MQALSCPKCGAPIQVGAAACPYCGVGLAPDSPGEREVYPLCPQPPIEVPAGWSLYKDPWHGFHLAHPAGWRVMTSQGQISVREDVIGLTAAVIWPFKLPRAASAREITSAFLSAGNKFAKGFQAWEQGSAAPDSNRISLRTRQVRGGQPIDGVFNILVGGENCIISGYEAPAAVVANRSPVLSQVLSTFRTAGLLERQRAQEPREGAYSIWMPKGWLFDATINRNTFSGSGLPQFVVKNDPQGRVMAALHSYQWVYQDVSVWYAGFTGYEPAQFMPADQYCVKKLSKDLAKMQKNLRVVSVFLRPDLVEIEESALVLSGYTVGSFETSIADMETTYEENGVRLRQRSRVVTQRQRSGGGIFAVQNPLWTAMASFSYRAPDGELNTWEPILTGVLDSIKPNPQWQVYEQQRVALDQQRVQNYLANAQADIHRRIGQISQTLSETSGLVASTYWDQQPTYDRLSDMRSDGMLGVHDVASDSGDVYKVPYGYDQYWEDGLGNLIGGSWMAQPGMDWRPLTPTGT